MYIVAKQNANNNLTSALLLLSLLSTHRGGPGGGRPPPPPSPPPLISPLPLLSLISCTPVGTLSCPGDTTRARLSLVDVEGLRVRIVDNSASLLSGTLPREDTGRPELAGVSDAREDSSTASPWMPGIMAVGCTWTLMFARGGLLPARDRVMRSKLQLLSRKKLGVGAASKTDRRLGCYLGHGKVTSTPAWTLPSTCDRRRRHCEPGPAVSPFGQAVNRTVNMTKHAVE